MFKQGDWIMTPDVEGVVEEIGTRATKIRTFSKAIVTVPNATLVNSAVTNWSKMTNRRIKMRLGLEYRTRRDQVTRIMQRIKDYLQNHPDIETKVVTFVYLDEFNESSIDILLYYFTKTTNWEEWLRIREENMLEFMKIIEDEGAAFAFPSQQLYVEKLPVGDKSPTTNGET
jgi:MscS family membrane protein